MFLDGHTDPNSYDVELWRHADEPFESTNIKTGEKSIEQDYCFSIATIIYDEHNHEWSLKSVGTRFLDFYEEGLNEYILKWIALANVCRGEKE